MYLFINIFNEGLSIGINSADPSTCERAEKTLHMMYILQLSVC